MQKEFSIILLTIIFISIIPVSAGAQEPDSTLGAESYDKGMVSYKAEKYPEAIRFFDLATQYFGEKYPAGHAKSLEWIGYGYLRMSEGRTLIEYFKKAEYYARKAQKKNGDYSPLINNQLMLAMMLRDMNEPREALEYFKNLEDLINQSEPNPLYLSIIYQNRAIIAMESEKFELVPNYLEKATLFAARSGNKRQYISV
ncbi:MAG: hypothetical protein WBA74_18755, partial [Cyclobacteriaceae bacterium]